MQFRVILSQKLVRRFLSIQKRFLERLRLNKNVYVVRQQCIQMNKFNTANNNTIDIEMIMLNYI